MKWVQSDTPLEMHPKKEWIYYLARQVNIDPILMHYLYQNGIDNEQKLSDYLFPSTKQFHDPYLLNDMRNAVVRIIQAIKRNERVLIFGDYDVDGITSSSLLLLGLRSFRANVSVRLPLREEGYGLTPEAIEKYGNDISLIITVDNGSSSHAAVALAKSKGIDVIVTDHHEITGEHPNCHAFINPKRSDNTYPFQGLCGAGVAFKLMQAICVAANISWDKISWDYITLAAIGTIADMMPLQDENRTICYRGLQQMNSRPLPPLKILFDLLKVHSVDSSTIAFSIAPILNAVGRISNPNRAVEILTNGNVSVSDMRELIEMNRNRQSLQSEQFQKVDHVISTNNLQVQKVIVVSEDLHHGIIGLLASNIAEKYQKPAIVISQSGVGSCRSVSGSNFSMIETIKKCQGYLKKFGGHQAAAGLTIDMNHLQHFVEAIQLTAAEQPETEPTARYLCQIPFHSFSNEFVSDIVCMEPFGLGNPKPLFYAPSMLVEQYEIIGKNHDHLKFRFGQHDAMAFRKASFADVIKTDPIFDFLYYLNSPKKKDFVIQQLRKSTKFI